MKYNEEVAYDLGLSLEDIYVLEKIEDRIRDTYLSKDGNNGEFSFNQVELFKICKFVFKQITSEDTLEDIKKIYKTNNAKFNKMLKGPLGKVLVKCNVVKKQGKSETYFKINKEIRGVLINGYPVQILEKEELTEIEKLILDKLNLNSLGKGIRTQLKNMDIDILKEAIQIAKEHNILDYPYVRKIYNNLEIKNPQEFADSQGSMENLNSLNNNSITQNIKNNKTQKTTFKKITRFHNVNETFSKYKPDELEKLLLESQRGKFK